MSEIIYGVVEVQDGTDVSQPGSDWSGFADGFWITQTVDGVDNGAIDGPFDTAEDAESAISDLDEAAQEVGRVATELCF